jgi:ABC-type branched-subunit amino acid transport system substrate-binding protein
VKRTARRHVGLRHLAALGALAVVIAACGGGGDVDEGESTTSGGSGSTTSADGPDPCEGATLEASETGISESEITITVMADTGSQLAPGLFQGPVDAVLAWGEWKNSQGGLACRQIKVETADSKLSPDEAKNGVTKACDTSLALVGTTALFVADVRPYENCEGVAGKGIPEFAVLQTEPVQQCSPMSFAVIPNQGACPYSGTGPRTFRGNIDMFQWYIENVEADLHGVWVIPSDLPSTITSSMPGFRMSQDFDLDGPGTDGIGLDAEFGASGLSPASAYTPFAAAIKENSSTYARVGLDYRGTVNLMKEAGVQGVDTVKVWDCSLQCYTKKLLDEGGDAVEGLYVWTGFTPFEEAGTNEVLDAFLEAVPEDQRDGFAAQAWAAAELFARAVDDAVAATGSPNITRQDLLAATNEIDDFDAGGFMGATDIAGKVASSCYVLMQVQDGAFVRVHPEAPGEFDCDGEIVEFELDAAKEFQG